jgi:hypothetical protein
MDFDGFEEELRKLMEGGASGKSSNRFGTKNEAAKNLDKFLKQEMNFKVGDLVERNEYGKNRYSVPAKNQVAQVLHIREDHNYDTPKGTNDEVGNNIVLAVAVEKDSIRLFEADSRFYRKAKEASNVLNLSKFKKGK